jgi:hypothetical protein
MIAFEEIKRIWKETAVAHSKVVSHKSLLGVEKNNVKI